jgi:hypothetical protein
MRRSRLLALAFLLAAASLLGGDPKTCMDLSAKIDTDVSSPSGIRVTITGRNNCSEDLDGRAWRFTVTALGSGSAAIATQNGRFGGTVASHGQVETKVFVVCDPDRARSVKVEAR